MPESSPAAGLPVPAERLTFSPCSRLLTYYAEAEKAEQGAGRFEQEVREFRAMFDALVPGTLVLLNEPFQSTAYDEGAKGLADILAYFSACGVQKLSFDGVPGHLFMIAKVEE